MRPVEENLGYLDLDNKNVIDPLLKKCRKGDRRAQKKLFQLLYPYSMSICLRYAHDEDEAMEVLNDGYLKIFSKIDQHNPNRSFKAWARRIFINTAIDHYRKNEKHYHALEITTVDTEHIKPEVLDNLAVSDILLMVSQLPPAYRLIFNLYVVEGYNHREIAEKIGISEGTSKSNLSKARVRLKKMIHNANAEGNTNYG
ncbi:MAG: RNA polymerase sigma factor [Cyclobacteriaceae bacterium]|nr:RNA polymerase sigma factor [Cyclobacteriaceae bacterium]